MSRPRRQLACLGVLIASLAAGCSGPRATEGGFDSANPAARMYAIEEAAREGDPTALRELVDQLDCTDPAVRFMAINALQRLTGQTLGYDYRAEAFERREAIDRWEDYVDEQEAEGPAPTGATAPAAEVSP